MPTDDKPASKTEKAAQKAKDSPPGAGGHWEDDKATGDRRWVYDDPAQDPTPRGAEA